MICFASLSYQLFLSFFSADDSIVDSGSNGATLGLVSCGYDCTNHPLLSHSHQKRYNTYSLPYNYRILALHC